MGKISENVLLELKRKNIKLSHQRLIILEYLTGNTKHPTADQVYHDLKPVIPSLSKTTIYNTLNLFVEAGIIRALNIEDNEIRHDFTTRDHGHFKCLTCGGIRDIEVAIRVGTETQALLRDYEIKQKDVYLKGICPDCLAAKQDKATS